MYKPWYSLKFVIINPIVCFVLNIYTLYFVVGVKVAWEQVQGATFSKSPGLGANFYIIYIFDAYMPIKACRMMN